MGNGGKDRDSESAQLVGGKRDLESAEEEDSSGDKCQESKGCGSKCLGCFRCVFGFALFPFVFLLTLLAILVWIILLPGTASTNLSFFLLLLFMLFNPTLSTKRFLLFFANACSEAEPDAF